MSKSPQYGPQKITYDSAVLLLNPDRPISDITDEKPDLGCQTAKNKQEQEPKIRISYGQRATRENRRYDPIDNELANIPISIDKIAPNCFPSSIGDVEEDMTSVNLSSRVNANYHDPVLKYQSMLNTLKNTSLRNRNLLTHNVRVKMADVDRTTFKSLGPGFTSTKGRADSGERPLITQVLRNKFHH